MSLFGDDRDKALEDLDPGGRRAATGPGWAPWGNKRRMRLMTAIGFPIGVLLLAQGIFLDVSGGGVFLAVVGGCMTLFWLVMIPLLRRQGKL
jgi:hypothetical protein